MASGSTPVVRPKYPKQPNTGITVDRVLIPHGCSAFDPNTALITRFLRQEFPEIRNGDPESIMEAIVAEMIGSRQVRLAERPSLESEVAMRELVRKCIELGMPIPVLVMSGPKKTVIGESIDVAEMSALRTLACLNKRVKENYAPGIDVRIRLEDITGLYLEEGVEGLKSTMDIYTGDFKKLTRIMGYGDFIEPILESEMMNEVGFRVEASFSKEPMLNYLNASDAVDPKQWSSLPEWDRLAATGWKGLVPPEMRAHYHHQYSRLYPELDAAGRNNLLAKYFAGTLARNHMGTIGVKTHWHNTGFFQINFAPPIPGIPKSLTSTRLYYRTVPLAQSKRHMPFWRAKGILKLNGEARLSLLSWNEPMGDITPYSVDLSDGKETVTLRADYLIDDHA